MKRNFCFCALTVLLLLGFSSPVISQFGDPAPYHPQEMDGYVNVLNRSVYFSETDLAVPGRGLGLNFTRTYNAGGVRRQQNDPSYIGHGWSHSYQWELRTQRPDNKTIWSTTWSVITGSGSVQTFTQVNRVSTVEYRPKSGVRGTFEKEPSGAFIYTTKAGLRYKFETREGTGYGARHVLTEIKDPNGNKITLHYENAPESKAKSVAATYPRLVAVEDSLGRILKFYYDDSNPQWSYGYERDISKIEFGEGTKTALTTVYHTVKYTYTRDYFSYRGVKYTFLASVAHQLGSDDPRGTEVKTQYEYNFSKGYHSRHHFGTFTAVVSPLGYRTEFAYASKKVRNVLVRDAPKADNTRGDVLNLRVYSTTNKPYLTNWTEAYTRVPGDYSTSVWNKRKKFYNEYYGGLGYVTQLNRRYWHVFYGSKWDSDSRTYWNYNYRNVTWVKVAGGRKHNFKQMLHYKIHYAGTNAAHNSRIGNPTKWEQIDPTSSTTVIRKWEADYEITYNRPIWQIDPMGHKTTFTYDTKGNLTEQRSKANTGTQSHAVDHDIITKHTYDSYGNRTKTTFMPDTTQEKVVETVYDSTKHTYPIEVKTTVTVDGTKHTIKTKSEWDVNRGLKTADIDAQGRRTEYAYWKDRRLKYTKRAADNMYTVPTYDKNGNVTQTQVRKDN